MAYTPIDKSNDYFETKLYTGTGSTQSITGLNFSPDWVWIKSRSNTRDHYLYDSVRGVNKNLFSNLSNAESTDTNDLMSYDANGFTLGGEAGVGASGETFVSWNWRGSDSSAVSNTAGSITSTVSANTTSGFSIVSYTGTGANATIGHGLGVAPRMIIFKSRNSATSWPVYHASLGATNFVALSNTDASSASSLVFNNTAPTSSLFSLGTSGGTNSTSMIAYCFAEVKGYSKAFSYTGNGSTDGSFIYCGFLPSFVLLKRTDSAGFNWVIHDNKRDINNPDSAYLHPNTSGSESTDRDIDLLSNGFKMRNSNTTWNASGGTYIGIAFASNPFVSSKGIPTCAF
jgi:hypothetical protein